MPSNSAAHLRPGSPGGLRSRVRGSTYCRAIRQRAVDVAQLEVRPVLHPVHPSRVHELVRGEAHRRQDPLGGGQLRRMFDLHQGHVTLPHHRVEVDAEQFDRRVRRATLKRTRRTLICPFRSKMRVMITRQQRRILLVKKGKFHSA